MKNIILSFVVLAISMNVFAQNHQEDMLKEMQKMQEEMMKKIENLDLNFDGTQLFIDTFFVKEFNSFGHSIPMDQFSGDLSELMETLQLQMQQMDTEDWTDMQQLFESFGDFLPVIPAPENLDKIGQEDGDIKEKPNKKRKTYTL